MADPAGLQYMLTLVGGSLDYIRHLSPQHRPGTVTHHHGEADHQAYLERPFLEAQSRAPRARLGIAPSGPLAYPRQPALRPPRPRELHSHGE